MSYSIAIDGPAGAGKSTIARIVAKKAGCIYVDTGAMYRAMALYLLRRGIPAGDEEAVSAACGQACITLDHEAGEQVVYLNGENVNGLIRTQEVGDMASVTSRYSELRKNIVLTQQKLAQDKDVIMDGRDIGTCVLPNATVKIYLTASVEVRARRRYRELLQKGENCNLDSVAEEIRERDHRDMTREVSPLVQARDAVLVDTSDMDIDQAVEAILAVCRRKGCPFSA